MARELVFSRGAWSARTSYCMGVAGAEGDGGASLMFRYEVETDTLFACCDVCENPVSGDEQRLIYRTDRTHRCGVIHADCVEKGVRTTAPHR